MVLCCLLNMEDRGCYESHRETRDWKVEDDDDVEIQKKVNLLRYT